MLKAYGPVMPGFLPGDELDNGRGDGTISVRKPNGMFLCVTPDGKVEERTPDHAGGPWESFRKGKGCLVAEREGATGPVVYVLSAAEV